MKNLYKKYLAERESTIFLRLAVTAIAVLAGLFFIFVVPNFSREIFIEFPSITYPRWLILVGFYGAALPFYIVLFQAMKLLNYIDTNKAFSDLSVQTLRKIKYAAATTSVVAYALVWPVFYFIAQADDAPGIVIVSFIFMSAPMAIGVFAAVLEKLLRSAIAIKTENELTV